MVEKKYLEKYFIVYPLVLMGLLFFVSSQAEGVVFPFAIPYADKVFHFLIFAILCALWIYATRSFFWSFIISVVYAFSDEWHQSFVVGRDASWGDLGADIGGVIVVLFVLRLRYNQLITYD